VIELVEHGGVGGAIVAAILAPGAVDVINRIRTIQHQTRQRPLLQITPERFSLVVAHQFPQFMFGQPFIYSIENRSYIASVPVARASILESKSLSRDESETVLSQRKINNNLLSVDPSLYFFLQPQYRFENFYHPYICLAAQALFEQGLDGILCPEKPDFSRDGFPHLYRQFYRELFPRFRDYLPTRLVYYDRTAPYSLPYEQFDFSTDGSYSLYNWELFFHIPLLVADRLSRNQRFEEAQRWFHYIFDPTDVSTYEAPAKYWRVKPLFEESQFWRGPTETLGKMMERLSTTAEGVTKQVEAWRHDPFNPHLLARLRRVAYMKTVVQKYLDNLIA
jgi:hypothetical protein